VNFNFFEDFFSLYFWLSLGLIEKMFDANSPCALSPATFKDLYQSVLFRAAVWWKAKKGMSAFAFPHVIAPMSFSPCLL
jgi:hypothetical protein